MYGHDGIDFATCFKAVCSEAVTFLICVVM